MNKQAKILLVLGLVAAGVAIAFVGSLEEGFKDPSDLLEDAAAYEGRHVDLKGDVVPGSVVQNGSHFTFKVRDDTTELKVMWTKPIPNHEAGGSIDGRTVTLKGFLQSDPHDGYVFHADDMVVGCASKYEAKQENATAEPGNGTAAMAG